MVFFHRQKQVQKAAAKAAEKAEDAQLLSAALIKESKIAAAEDAHKTLLSTAQRQYRYGPQLTSMHVRLKLVN